MHRTHTPVAVAVTAALITAVAAGPASAAPAAPGPNSPKAAARAALAAGHRPPGQHLSALTLGRASAVPAGHDAVLVAHLDGSVPVSDVVRSVRGAHLTVRHALSQLRAVTVRVSAADRASAAAALDALPGVRSVETAVTRRLQDVPDDTDYAADQASYLDAVNAPAAWSVQHGSNSVVIAVVDSGVDVTHEDLTGKIVGTYNAVDGSADVTDTLGHGTFVAGVAAADTNNALGVAGAGYDTSVLAVKVADSSGNISVDSEAAGITWAADHGANIINLSLGSATPSTVEKDAITYAQGKGVLVVAAAGNENTATPDYPAGYSGVVAVAATDGSARASFSNYGSWVTLAAPGVHIFSTTPPAGSQFWPAAAAYQSGDGTSFSTPLVAGAAALLKAQNPAATAAQIRAALVNSAHGFAGQQVGAGQVDFSAAFTHLVPSSTPTITSPVSGGTVSGVITLSATSNAPSVAFRIDTGAWSAPVTVSGGSASLQQTLWGSTNGTHTVAARDCTAFGECSSASVSSDFTLANGAPSVTSPAPGATITGGFTMTATAPGGGVRFLIDGKRVGFDATSPYSLSYSGSALAYGSHTATAVECSTTETQCAGPVSPAVTFRSNSLHPSIVSISPNPFSPNGDRQRDTTTLTISLPDTETTVVRVYNRSGTEVRGAALGTLAAGRHTWVWNGKLSSGQRVADGSYTVNVNTSKTINGVVVLGAVTTHVTVDVVAPGLWSVTGAGATFYPYPDGFGDTIRPGVTVGERGALRLYVRNLSNVTVRVLSMTANPGRAALTWTGYTSAGHLAPAGYYRFFYWITDAAGNVRQTSAYTFYASGKRLYARSATLSMRGYTTRTYGDSSCMLASGPDSDYYPNGVWLDNECDPYVSYEYAVAYYRFTVPGAVRYGTMRTQVYGNTISPPSEMFAQFCGTSASTCAVGGDHVVTRTGGAWQNLGTASGAGRVDAQHHIDIGVAVDDYYNDSNGFYASDFDIKTVQLSVTYYILA